MTTKVLKISQILRSGLIRNISLALSPSMVILLNRSFNRVTQKIILFHLSFEEFEKALHEFTEAAK
jgi:hypothetical protein